MQAKAKDCSRCKKPKVIFKNQKVGEEKFQYCQQCWNIFSREKTKEKKKIKREKKRETITEKKLDALQSKVIRTLYGDKCCTCGNVLEFSKLHNGHFQSRQFRVTRFNPQNCASQCPSCNLYLQGAQYEFGKFINSFHGEGTAEKMISLTKSPIKIGLVERKALYQIYENALEHKDLQRLIKEYYQIIK